jgi:hypothetical protein
VGGFDQKEQGRKEIVEIGGKSLAMIERSRKRRSGREEGRFRSALSRSRSTTIDDFDRIPGI